MPTPGSHSYDVRRTRLRGKLETEGIPDKNADEAANQIMRRNSSAASPGLRSDRAAGPYGERTAGGDPGNVIPMRSPAFNDNTTLPARCSREGGDRSPPLEWDDPPPEAVELALVCEDPDAPEGPFLHWLVTGIPAGTTSIAEGEVPPGADVWPNDYGEVGYGGPLPPVGDDPHRYMFRLFALGSPLGMSPGADVAEVRAALEDRRLATGTLIGLFAR
jgi:Raf kinase inhibitor-like YbhB/YbcL family protein